jgi:hypothetical protein
MSMAGIAVKAAMETEVNNVKVCMRGERGLALSPPLLSHSSLASQLQLVAFLVLLASGEDKDGGDGLWRGCENYDDGELLRLLWC